jgi:hypothetical protein
MRSKGIGTLLAIGLAVVGCKSEPEVVTTPGPAGTGPGPTPSKTSDGKDAGAKDGGGAGGGDAGGGTPDASVAFAGCDVVTAGGGVQLGTASGTTPSIAWGGTSFGLAWQADPSSGGGIRFARVGREGTVLGEVTLTTEASAALPRVYADGGGFGVTWQEGTAGAFKLRMARVDGTGAPAGAACQLATSDAEDARPMGAAVKAGRAAAWMTASGALVAPIGSSCATQGKLVLDGAGFPSLAACGTGFVAAYTRASRVLVAPLAAGASSLGAEVAVRDAAGVAHLPRAACAASRSFVAWEDERAGLGNERVYLAGVGADGAALPETEVPTADGSANWPDVAAVGDGVAVAYYQFRAGPPAIYLATFGAGLARVGGDTKLSGDTGAKYPSVAWSGAELAIVWAELTGSLRAAIARCH